MNSFARRSTFRWSKWAGEARISTFAPVARAAELSRRRHQWTTRGIDRRGIHLKQLSIRFRSASSPAKEGERIKYLSDAKSGMTAQRATMMSGRAGFQAQLEIKPRTVRCLATICDDTVNTVSWSKLLSQGRDTRVGEDGCVEGVDTSA